MTTALNRRLAALEQASRPQAWPQVIFVAAMGPAGAECAADDVRFAYVLGSRHGEISRGDGEPLDSFLCRVEVERVRVHGGGSTPRG